MQIKKLQIAVLGASMLMLTAFAGQSTAGVSVNIGVFAPPPVYVAAEPPAVVLVPGTYVYAVPDPAVQIFFYHGYWWRSHEGHWFRSNHYDGSWVNVRNERVPRAVVAVPRDYHRHLPNDRRISHDDMKRNWKKWEKEKHWEREHDRRYAHEERRDHDDRDREGHGGRERHFERY